MKYLFFLNEGIGLCGEPCPMKCRHCDKDIVQEIFFGTEDEADARFVFLPDCGHMSNDRIYFSNQTFLFLTIQLNSLHSIDISTNFGQIQVQQMELPFVFLNVHVVNKRSIVVHDIHQSSMKPINYSPK